MLQYEQDIKEIAFEICDRRGDSLEVFWDLGSIFTFQPFISEGPRGSFLSGLNGVSSQENSTKF